MRNWVGQSLSCGRQGRKRQARKRKEELLFKAKEILYIDKFKKKKKRRTLNSFLVINNKKKKLKNFLEIEYFRIELHTRYWWNVYLINERITMDPFVKFLPEGEMKHARRVFNPFSRNFSREPGKLSSSLKRSNLLEFFAPSTEVEWYFSRKPPPATRLINSPTH